MTRYVWLEIQHFHAKNVNISQACLVSVSVKINNLELNLIEFLVILCDSSKILQVRKCCLWFYSSEKYLVIYLDTDLFLSQFYAIRIDKLKQA